MFGSHRSSPACIVHRVPPKKLKTAVISITISETVLLVSLLELPFRFVLRFLLDDDVPVAAPDIFSFDGKVLNLCRELSQLFPSSEVSITETTFL